MPSRFPQTLAELRAPRLEVSCRKCGRRGNYSVARLIAAHGDMRLLDLRWALMVDCPNRKSHNLHNWCDPLFEERQSP